MAQSMKEVGNGGQGGPMVNMRKNIAQGNTVDVGGSSVPKIFGGKPARVNPNRGMSHAPLADSARCCAPPKGSNGMASQCDPNHGPCM